MNLFEKVMEKAKEKGIRITNLEKAAGMSKGSICKWEHGNPRINNLQAVAKVLGVSIIDLIEEEEDGTAVQ